MFEETVLATFDLISAMSYVCLGLWLIVLTSCGLVSNEKAVELVNKI